MVGDRMSQTQTTRRQLERRTERRGGGRVDWVVGADARGRQRWMRRDRLEQSSRL